MTLFAVSKAFIFALSVPIWVILLHHHNHADAFVVKTPTCSFRAKSDPVSCRSTMELGSMKRPILDQIASTLFKLETSRVEKSSVLDEKGRMGEPMEWSESSSWANQFSEWIASNSLGYAFKQWVADIVAGDDYDKKAITAEIDDFVATNQVAMFSFTTCPFCRRAKDLLTEKGVPYQTIELDELDGNKGNQIRAMLGRKTKRTSVPSIFINGQYIGGCNDGPGIIPLNESGQLDELLKTAASS